MHFFTAASLPDCCRMKRKLSGPIVHGSVAMSSSPLDSVSLRGFCTLKSSGLSVFLVMGSMSCAAS